MNNKITIDQCSLKTDERAISTADLISLVDMLEGQNKDAICALLLFYADGSSGCLFYVDLENRTTFDVD